MCTYLAEKEISFLNISSGIISFNFFLMFEEQFLKGKI